MDYCPEIFGGFIAALTEWRGGKMKYAETEEI